MGGGKLTREGGNRGSGSKRRGLGSQGNRGRETKKTEGGQREKTTLVIGNRLTQAGLVRGEKVTGEEEKR